MQLELLLPHTWRGLCAAHDSVLARGEIGDVSIAWV
jgi:hypothetical protein